MYEMICAGRRQKTFPSSTSRLKKVVKIGGKKKGKKKKKTGR